MAQSDPNIPTDVAAFLSQHIRSLHQLEILLHVYQHAGTAWTASEVAQRLYLPPELVAERLADLEQRGLVLMTQEARQLPRYQAIGSHADQIKRLDHCYGERRVSVISFIFAQPDETVRSFADAFKLRKER